MRELTTLQDAFVEAYVANGGNGTAAAKAAGYSEVSARQLAFALLNTEHIRAAIHREQARIIGNELANKSIGVLRGILDDDTASSKVRLEAAKTVLDRAGHIAPKAADPADDEQKPLSEMTVDELEDFIRKGREALERMNYVTVESTAEEVAGAPDGTPQATDERDETA